MNAPAPANLAARFAADGVRDVECLFPDVSGDPRGKRVPAAAFAAGAEPRIAQAIPMQGVTADCSCDPIFPGQDPDVLLVPYRRFVKGSQAPVDFHWGHDDRTAGLDGIERALPPTEPLASSAYGQPHALARGFEAAHADRVASEVAVRLFGQRFVTAYGAVREVEFDSGLGEIGAWQRRFRVARA